MKTYWLFLPALVLLFSSCKSNDSSTNSDGGATGDLRGVIILYDYNNNPVQDKSGVLVQLKGTSYSAITDTGGLWVIHNLPTRTYDLIFSKDTYATYYGQIVFVGGSTLWYTTSENPTTIAQVPKDTLVLDELIIPKIVVDSLGHESISPGSLYAHFSKNAPLNTNINSIYISSHTYNPDLNNPQSYTGFQRANNAVYKINPDSLMSTGLLIEPGYNIIAGFSSGDSIYIRGYPFNGYNPLYYNDATTAVLYYYALGIGSNVLSGVLP